MEPNDDTKCIVCRTATVTWPLVCDGCTDHEAQGELASEYGLDCFEAGPNGDIECVTGMECRTCGMIHDGGQSCNYCGDRDPLDQEILDEQDRAYYDSWRLR